MKTTSKPKKWAKTATPNLLRYVPSGCYYARLRVGGKLIWRSLETDSHTVAKLKLRDVESEERSLQLGLPLMVRGRLGERQKEQESADEHHRMMRHPNCEPKKHDVHSRYPPRHPILGRGCATGRRLQCD